MKLSVKANWRVASVALVSMAAGGLLVLLVGYLALDPLLKSYILENPEIIIESVQQYEVEQQRQIARRAISLNYSAIFEDESSQVGGNPDGDVTLVEFFDYQCGFCKQALPDMIALAEDQNLRIIYKDYPILGPESIVASRAALASARQGMYLPFHHALMAFEGTLTDAAIMEIAMEVGLDLVELAADMNDPMIMLTIRDNLVLASNLDLSGTPTFVLNDEIIVGAVGLDELRDHIARARAEIEG